MDRNIKRSGLVFSNVSLSAINRSFLSANIIIKSDFYA